MKRENENDAVLGFHPCMDDVFYEDSVHNHAKYGVFTKTSYITMPSTVLYKNTVLVGVR